MPRLVDDNFNYRLSLFITFTFIFFLILFQILDNSTYVYKIMNEVLPIP